jgi:hypothetical protein
VKKILSIVMTLLALVMFVACSQNKEAAYNPLEEISVPPGENEDAQDEYAQDGNTQSNNEQNNNEQNENAPDDFIEANEEEDDAPPSKWEGLQMHALDGSVTPTGLRLSMVNASETQEFGHGTPFHVEEYSDGEWSQVPLIGDSAWFLPLLIIKPDKISDEDIFWEHMYGQLTPGEYRVARSFIFNPSDMASEWDEKYIYAEFTLREDWQERREQWQRILDSIAEFAFGRFAYLDLEITEHSTRGLSFTLTNNNYEYGYIIEGIFVGWSWKDPPGSRFGASGLEYSVYDNWDWEKGERKNEKRLQPGEFFSLDVDWYDEIGELHADMSFDSPHPNIFELVVSVSLDVDDEYMKENFRRTFPDLPGASHRIQAEFDISN